MTKHPNARIEQVKQTLLGNDYHHHCNDCGRYLVSTKKINLLDRIPIQCEICMNKSHNPHSHEYFRDEDRNKYNKRTKHNAR